MVEAILEGLLLRDAASEQLTLDIGLERREELHKEWDSAAEKEKLSRTKYAQSGIQPGEVARELDEIRASLGTASDVRGFAEEALRALRADVTPVSDGFTAATGALPAGLRDALVAGHAEPLPFRVDLPVKPREAYLDRTDPNVAAIARYVLESALDSVTPADPATVPRAAAASCAPPPCLAAPRCCWSGSACTWNSPAATAPASSSPKTPRSSPTAASRPPPSGCRLLRWLRCWPPCRPATSRPIRPEISPNGRWRLSRLSSPTCPTWPTSWR